MAGLGARVPKIKSILLHASDRRTSVVRGNDSELKLKEVEPAGQQNEH